MSKNSDHNKPQFDITKYLPEVYRSDVNNSLFNMAFNRHLTKDDTQRVAGIIGESSPTAIIKRQITESTPHRQAYQLAPTMYSKVGTIETALSYKAFLQQLSLMDVPTDRLPKWANTLKFNWVPPINLDMFINYQDYFWAPRVAGEAAEYFTIENRCSKLKSKLASYETTLDSRGSTFSVAKIDVAANQFQLEGRYNDLFIDGFVFFTTGTSNVNLSDRFWTVDHVEFEESTQLTKVTLVEPLALVGEDQPTTDIVGRWWYNPTGKTLRQWNGSSWSAASSAISVTISLAELRAVYQSETNCACTGGTGWDLSLWDDNQVGIVMWDQEMFSSNGNPDPAKRIDFATEADWLAWNIANPQSTPVVVSNTPVDLALWYDTSNDQLKQYSATNGSDPTDGSWTPTWVAVVNNFSALRDKVTGINFWDQTAGCEPQVLNSWSGTNRWIHKTQVKSFGGVKRAQLPILEFDSSLELNKWTQISRTWKYRAEPGQEFKVDETGPQRIELEPVKGFCVAYINNTWYLYLYDQSSSSCRDINYTKTFVPGYQFRVVDDTAKSDTYTVHSSSFRWIFNGSDPEVQSIVGTNKMVTVVRLVETDYLSELRGGGVANTRLEPRMTSRGTPWRGYHIHWMLDADNVQFLPTGGQPTSPFRRRDMGTEPTVELVAGNTAYTNIGFQPALQTEITLGVTYQELILSVPSVRAIDLAPHFRCDGTGSNLFAIAGSEDLRVYVNGVRQYGNYSERTATATPDFTTVGSIGHSSAAITYVTGIDFERPLTVLDTVRIEVGPASFQDTGMYCVPVRTVENEAAFTLGVAAGTQPVYTSLSSFVLKEQVKTKANQNPLFNVYDLASNETISASPIFNYKEDSEADVNTTLQRRIATGNASTDYVFTQDLIDRDNNILFGYRDISNSSFHQYWYNPATKEFLIWDGDGWTEMISSAYTEGFPSYYFIPVISDTEPESLFDSVFSLWYSPAQGILFQRTPESTWQIFSGAYVGQTDPKLKTIWRHGSTYEEATPQYVDKDRNETTVGNADGDWGIVDQWIYNPEHENRKDLRFTELFTHFNSILRAQPKAPGLQGGGVYALSQMDFNYGLGGTIKEYNGSFDTLISAVNVTNITPPGIIEFAAREYASSLLQLRDMFTKLGPKLLQDDSDVSILDLSGYLTSRMIALFQSNDSIAQIFGDTSAYDAETGAGVKNWVASAPMFSLAPAYKPYLNATGNFVELVHHDGHRSVVTLSIAEIDRIARTLCNTVDTRTATTFGKVSTSAPPTTAALMTSNFGGIRRGAYWYRSSGNIHKLYRFEVFTVGASAPAAFVNGIAIPDGSTYYNISTEAVYQKVAGSWVAITTLGAGDVSPLWEEVDLSLLFGEILLEVENRLYDVTPSDPLVYDYPIDDDAVHDALLQKRFSAYARNNEITAPLVNVQYVPTDPFTWNYSTSVSDTAPLTGATPTDIEAASSWQELYTRWFGTPYPHLEPWKLQGYTNKPDWWDDEYRDTTGARRWIYNHATKTGMWENIRRGVVPVGRRLPPQFTAFLSNGLSTGADGEISSTYNYFCVNISDVDLGGFPPDAILPPYFADVHPADTTVRCFFTDYASQLVSIDADYIFGDGSPVEWQWKTSLEYTYDQMIIAFAMQPMRFMQKAFGPRFTSVDGLDVELLFKQVYSHTDAMFHGDVFGQNNTYTSRGLNQWYVNFNRRSGYNTNGEFRQLWAGWKPTMTYQFGGIVDTNTFEIANKYIDIIPHDYNILLVNNGVFKDMWMDAFEVSLVNIPPPIIQYNNQSQWKLDVDSLASSSRTLSYYGVKEYSQTADPVLTRPVNIVSTGATSFVVPGNQLAFFYPGNEINVTGSDMDDGTYTVRDAVYDASSNQTTIAVLGVVQSGHST